MTLGRVCNFRVGVHYEWWDNHSSWLTQGSWCPDICRTVCFSSNVLDMDKTLGLLRRPFSSCHSPGRKKTLLVKSQLLYCSQIWRQHLIKDIKELEKVQRRATKWILNDYSSDYKARLESQDMLPLMYVLEPTVLTPTCFISLTRSLFVVLWYYYYCITFNLLLLA